jgi:5-methyltetrahydropteroyltriglutamate--homocysteine methyltransferase
MQRTEDRILTTHAGSLPREERLLDLVLRRSAGRDVDAAEFRTVVLDATQDIIRRQLAAGIDVGNDGELPRPGFNIYVKDRMSGFGGRTVRKPFSDFVRFPDYGALRMGAAPKQGDVSKAKADVEGAEGRAEGAESVQTAVAVRAAAPAAVDEIVYDETLAGVREELEHFEEALAATRAEGTFAETFISAASPGNVMTALSRHPDNPVYATDDEYVFGVARALKHEYEEIVARGHLLQIDAPDLAMERQIKWQDDPLSEFLERIAVHVEAINLAIADIPPDRVRLHVCWGNWDGPHVDDVDLADVLPIIYGANVGAYCIPCGNPRHQHEHRQFGDHPLPDGKQLIAGVIDVTTNYVEHPEVVADRLCRLAEFVDPRSLIAAPDCGFSTFAGYTMVANDVLWAKLATMRRGAEIASERLL